MNNTIFTGLLLLLLSGCGNFSGEASETEKQTKTASSTTLVNSHGLEQYQALCLVCHGDDGLGTPVAPSMTGCATCTDVNTLATRITTTMPIGIADIDACEGECAQNIAEYILQAFNDDEFKNAANVVADVELLNEQETLRKASLNLAGRLPTATENELATSKQGLQQALDLILNEERFYDRLMEIYNDLLLTDKYLGSENALNLLDSKDYPNRRWYRDLALDTDIEEQRTEYYDLRQKTNDAVARENLQLITYVVKNNRPFSEILTADYQVMNPFSAKTYGVKLTFENPNNANEFKEGRINGIPHAGILTSSIFLNRFPTTTTNRNRHRARIIFDLFLDTDILAIEGSRPGDAIDLVSQYPTLQNASCYSCHTLMDPVASSFQNWDDRGRYRVAEVWHTDMEARGIAGKVMPLKDNTASSLQWLAQQMVSDSRFARATVRNIYRGLMGKEPLRLPATSAANNNDEATDDNNDKTLSPEKQAYLSQRKILTDIEKDFVADNWNLKTLIKSLILSPYFRAKGLTNPETETLHKDTGYARILTPEMLDRKITTLFGMEWKQRSWSSTSRLKTEEISQLYGGIDSDQVTKRITQPNGLMVAVQQRMATELSCNVIARDFFKPRDSRLLFPQVARSTMPQDEDGIDVPSNIDAIKTNIQHLHWHLLGEQLDLNHEEINTSYQLFYDVWSQGNVLLDEDYDKHRSLPSNCRLYYDPETEERLSSRKEISQDTQYTLRAWMAVLSYLIADYRFVYE
jgi:mono/diheme cytochrome c family protein